MKIVITPHDECCERTGRMDHPTDLDVLRWYAISAGMGYDDAAFVAAMAVPVGGQTTVSGLVVGRDDAMVLIHPINFVSEEMGEWILAGNARRLYAEHSDTDIHTGDNFVDGCPTCESWGEVRL